MEENILEVKLMILLRKQKYKKLCQNIKNFVSSPLINHDYVKRKLSGICLVGYKILPWF